MNIAKYISELLFNYECVVLPGFGGFITNRKPAAINRITHQFNPPYSQIFFNRHLTANDGLLIKHIAFRNNISYETARNLVDVFVKSVQLRLESSEKVLLENIGTLEIDVNQNIRFEQSTTINYNPESFGLSSLISPAIRRKTDEEKLRGLILAGTNRSKPADRKVKIASRKKKKGFVRSSVTIALLALFVFSLSWALVERDQVADIWQEQASILSFNNSTAKYQPRSSTKLFHENDLSELENAEGERVEEILTVKEKTINDELPSAKVTETHALEETMIKKEESAFPEAKPEANNTKVDVVPNVKPTAKIYYVVAGSFSNELNASKLVTDLKKKGYNAMIADTTKNGMFRVAYLGVENLALAREQLFAIRQEDNPDAWIFRK